MNKKFIDKLVAVSVKNNELQKDKIDYIANKLSRQNLKLFITALRKWIKEHTVYIEYAIEPSNDLKKEFEDVYRGKRVVFLHNSNLMVGIRVTENDTIYEMNLHNTLEDLTQYINQ